MWKSAVKWSGSAPTVEVDKAGSDLVFTVTGSSAAACPYFTKAMIWEFIKENKLIFTVIYGVIGIFLILLGRKMISWTIALTIFIAVFVACMYVTFRFAIKVDSPKWL